MTYDPNRPRTPLGTEREIDRTTGHAHDAIDTTSEQAHRAVEGVKDTAQQAADKAQQLGEQAVERADAATTAVGERMTDAAQAIREKAPASGAAAQLADTAANTLERAGSYLQEQDLAAMRADLEGLIRRHPIESLLIGMGIGYLLARSTRR
jgi:ElaB/YqjD/DUF883 family membrane-anchored ribosome-binding protein